MLKKFIVILLVTGSFLDKGLAQPEVPYVILVSFDGFRHDYVEKFNLPNFNAFIQKGAQAEGIIPCFPSLTFPNHYSLVTGLYPGHHGIVDNNFYDTVRQSLYRMADREKVEDPYYYGGTPLWQLAREHGLKSASFFWVGSEITDKKKRPDYYFRYDSKILFQSRIEQVISWLRLPEQERPHFITLYFSSPDHESHRYGPLAEETKEILFEMDSLLGNLMRGLSEINLPINTILVSDHGMSELIQAPETYIFLNELININDSTCRILHSRTLTQFYVKNPTKVDSLYNLLKQQENNYSVLRKKDLPDHWQYQHSRVGDLLMVAKPNHIIQLNERAELLQKITPGSTFGVHGYDPKLVKDMLGIFYAKGPNIKVGIKIPAFQNIDVYPLVAKILNLQLPPIDGNPKTLKKVYKK